MPSAAAILRELERHANPRNVAGMARYGISTRGTLGIQVVTLRGLARTIGRSHALALELWASGVHEARLLAAFIEEPALVTAGQMERWIRDVDSWDICDQVCANVFAHTRFARSRAVAWARRAPEFVKRAGFVLIARLAVSVSPLSDRDLEGFLPVILRGADDGRPLVKKGVSWALRQIGKRSPALNAVAQRTARTLRARESPSARWVGSDAMRDLTSPVTRRRFAARAGGRAASAVRSPSRRPVSGRPRAQGR